MKKISANIIAILIAIVLILPVQVVQAQNTTPSGPVYIVQEGDSLWDIAYRFHIPQEELANANGIIDPDQISIGQPLVIPGLEGIQGVLTTQEVPYGETLHSLSLRYGIAEQLLKRLNHITSPNELYAGYWLVIPQEDSPPAIGKRGILNPGQSILELAILNDTDPWSLLADNGIESGWSALPGDVLRLPGEIDPGPGGLPPAITAVSISGLTQGKTSAIRVAGEAGLSLTGSLIDHPLIFYAEKNDSNNPAVGNGFIALQGIHAMAEPGLYPLVVQLEDPPGFVIRFSQMVMVRAGNFLYDRPLPVDPATLDPETNRTENELWFASSSEDSPEKLWSGPFDLPVDPLFAGCYSSRFGSRRSYNGSEYIYFHTGLDFCGQVGDPVYAAAPGVVVFVGPLTVRGEATMIDHGQGVFSAYMHQSEILVGVGEHVQAGQLIGRVGNTGRVEGPHLHFEVLVGGVQVDPLEWLDGEFP